MLTPMAKVSVANKIFTRPGSEGNRTKSVWNSNRSSGSATQYISNLFGRAFLQLLSGWEGCRYDVRRCPVLKGDPYARFAVGRDRPSLEDEKCWRKEIEVIIKDKGVENARVCVRLHAHTYMRACVRVSGVEFCHFKLGGGDDGIGCGRGAGGGNDGC